MQADQDTQVAELFGAVVALLIATAIISSIQGKVRDWRTVLMFVVGILFGIAAIFWSGLKSWVGTQLAASIEGVATNFSVWLLIIGLLWLYGAVMTVLTAVRQNNEIIALRNDIQSIAKVLETLVIPWQIEAMTEKDN